MLLNILIFILACYGVTMLVVQSKITKPIRDFFIGKIELLHDLLSCMMCTGFWVGFIASIFFNYSITYNAIGGSPNMIFFRIFDGALMSCIIWLIYLIQLNLEIYVKSEL